MKKKPTKKPAPKPAKPRPAPKEPAEVIEAGQGVYLTISMGPPPRKDKPPECRN